MSKTYIISLFAGCAIMVLAGLCSYQYVLLNEAKKPSMEETPGTAAFTAATPDEIVLRTTEYVIEKYDASTKKLTSIKCDIPVAVLGLNRDELIAYVNEYEKEPSLEDINLGFISAEVLSFSRERVIIRKYYEGIEDDLLQTNCYILVIENGYVNVYKNDYHHLFMKTDIKKKNLSAELEQEMLDGKIFYDLSDLYNFLETYSS